MKKTKFLGKVLSLALAITLIAGMVPEMHAKAAESETRAGQKSQLRIKRM